MNRLKYYTLRFNDCTMGTSCWLGGSFLVIKHPSLSLSSENQSTRRKTIHGGASLASANSNKDLLGPKPKTTRKESTDLHGILLATIAKNRICLRTSLLTV